MRLIIWIRCLFGHQWTKTPIVVHAAAIKLFNVPAHFPADGEPAASISKFLIGHRLFHCELCGRVEFSPWTAKEDA